MVIHTLGTDITAHHVPQFDLRRTTSVSKGTPVARLRARLSDLRLTHTPQDPINRQTDGMPPQTTAAVLQMYQDELASIKRSHCDVQLLTGNIEQDIAILNVVA